MKIGLKLPSSGPLAKPAFIAELAEMGDRLGYDSLQVSDHVVVPAEIRSRYPYSASGLPSWRPETDYFEPISMLGFLAGRTHRARLGTSVLVLPYRHPVVTAKQLASIDALSGGRVFIGVGAGWQEEEFKILGSPPFAERGAITDEYIQVFRAIWNDELPEFHGKYVQFPPLGAHPQPVQKPSIPIIVGGHTRPAIRRAARLGDGWMPIRMGPDGLIAGLQYLRKQAQEIGRDLSNFEISLGLVLRMTRGPAERHEGEDPWTTLVGPARELMGTLRSYRDIGVTEIAFSLPSGTGEDEAREIVQLCGEYLVPAFAGS
jgi:probable F420-dependent oxidoreductase